MPEPESRDRDWGSIKAWANAIGYIGIPGSIAIFVVYIGATELPELVKSMQQIVIQVKTNHDLLHEHMEQTSALIRAVQRTCSNAAKDDSARQACFDR